MQQKIVIVGAGGQLGQELVRAAGAEVECIPLTRSQLDIENPDAVIECLAALKPQQVINTAAYTAVDQAESEPQVARRANAEAPGYLAMACKQLHTRLIHVSTDFVFNGESSHPYPPDAPTAPLGEYGRGKLAGELAVQRILPRAFILRTAWVYSSFGNNFVKTMLRLMAQRDELSVVADQVGAPTWARGLADALWAVVARPQLQGIYHWSDGGVCSWYDFAVAICEDACDLGLLARPVKIRPIPASEYPTPARRPAYSVLDKESSYRDMALEGVHWRQQLRAMLMDYKELNNG